MKKSPVASASAVLLLALVGCAPGSEAADAVYEECSPMVEVDDSTEQPFLDLIRIDGATITVGPRGDLAADVADFDGSISNMDSDSGRAALRLFLASECVVDETGYPGASEDLEDGEEWDGWRYSYAEGAGSEFSMVFTATR